jgi:hypothetical protein
VYKTVRKYMMIRVCLIGEGRVQANNVLHFNLQTADGLALFTQDFLTLPVLRRLCGELAVTYQDKIHDAHNSEAWKSLSQTVSLA